MTNKSHSEKPAESNRQILLYLLLWVAAFVIRMVYLYQIMRTPGFDLLLGDAVTYDSWASQIANGDWIGKGVFYQAPLYPYFLGVIYSLVGGRDLLVVRLVQAVLGASSCVLLAQAGRRFFNRTAIGLVAGVLLAVYPTAIFFDGSIQKSVLDSFFVCALLATLGKLLEHSQNRWWLIAGFLLGMLALTRENALVFLPIILAWLLTAWQSERWSNKIQWVALFFLGLMAVLLPVGYRNLRVGGEFHLTTAQFGPNFYMGNSKFATGFYEPLKEGRGYAVFEREDARTQAEQATGRNLTPSEVSNYWAVKALDDIRADVPRWLRLAGKKWLLVWNISEIGDSDDQYTYGDWSPLLQGLNPLLHFGTLCPLVVMGICLTWNLRQRVWILWVMILGYAASVTLFYVFSRYRFSLVPIMIPFAAAGLTSLRAAFREKRWQALVTAAATAVVVAAICNQALMPEALIRSGTNSNLGNAFFMESRFEEAIGQYEQALKLNPNDRDVPSNLAAALMRAGRYRDAIGYCEQALRIDPDDAYSHYNLGEALIRLGQPAQAIPHLEQTLRIDPNKAEAHNDLGNLLLEQGQAPEAMGHWERALQIKPTFAEAHFNLANALLRNGRLEEAIEHYNQALSIRPDYAKAHFNLAITLEKAGRLQAAVEHYEQAALLKPDLVDARRLAGLRAKLPLQSGAR
jgi:tetratricopeptide (TPR) repeat protein